MGNLKITEEFYRELESMNWFQRLFSWGKILTLSRKSYSEIEKSLDSGDNTIEIKTKLEASQKEVRTLENQLGELKGEKKAIDDELKKSISKLGQLEKSDSKNVEEIANLKLNTEILKQRNGDFTNDKKELEKKIISIEKELDQKRKQYDDQVTRVQSLQESLTREMERLNDERVKEKEKDLEEMKKTWKIHESNVENEIRLLCERNVLEYVDKSNFPTRKKPDNSIKVLDELVVFDAKSPSNDDLSNFSKYINEQTKLVEKYIKNKEVKKDVFLVVPTNTLDILPKKFFNMGDYRVYVITKEAIEPIIKSFKKIEEYDSVQEFTPEDREKICQVLGGFAHATKRRVQIDAFFMKEFAEIWKKTGNLPENMKENIESYELSGKLINPPMDTNKTKISVTSLDKDRIETEKELEIIGVNSKVKKKDIDTIELYEKKSKN